ncbi:hypothetical protein SAMN05216350_107108 [Polaromonas sp. YR568]|uniref:hypothetical protein n=1 Tax=Polaromonas sp. YR568 TaxID=1855301 RepID=UPI0008EDE194|nr:hypothetical protein [Polaromonas sp. YR568]SFU88673.1 hypothetical protein SAMN05216350_107108 [Polaromonas sp. YR568]
MNFHSDSSTVSSAFRPSAYDVSGELMEATRHEAPEHKQSKPRSFRRPRAAAYIAFFITVFASMAAAAALATHDIPLMVVGL